MFEAMLARKYITAQKRHSALTICSIAIALALITMLFSVFSTVISCLRNYAYEQGAHIKITGIKSYWMNAEQRDTIAQVISEYGTYTVEEFLAGTAYGVETKYYINILLDKDIDSAELLMFDLGLQTGYGNINYETNDLLMLLDMKDSQSRLYMAAIVALFYAFVLFLIMMLRLIIDTAFEISSKERERQLGVLQSIGATPKQIVRIITYEGLTLSVIGIPLGVGLGIGLGYIAYRAVLSTGLADLYLSPSKAEELIYFTVNPWLLLLGVATGAAWVLFSAYGTGMRVIKMSPVQAISQRSNTVKKVGKFSLFGKMFGWTGKIASRNNFRQPKRFIATVISLTLSIALFSAVTVITDNLQDTAKLHYDEMRELFPGDFYGYFHRETEPFGYQKYLYPLEESGLFSEVLLTLKADSGSWTIPDEVTEEIHYGGATRSIVEYYSRDEYNRIFDGNPPVSYEKLTESGGYILLGEIAQESIRYGFRLPENITLSFSEGWSENISEEEYNALPPEEQEKYSEYYTYESYEDYIAGIIDELVKIKRYSYYPQFTVDYKIYQTADSAVNEWEERYHRGYGCWLVGTLDEYENGGYTLYDKFVNPNLSNGEVYCVIEDDSRYFEAYDFMYNLFGKDGFQDNSLEFRQLRAMMSSVKIIAVFFSILIALIAVVNMVNILATGILNRRGELAAMQCVGMTERQLYKMTFIECLQYALTSGVLAVGVCELIMFITEKMLGIVIELINNLGRYISYIQPLPIIAVASISAFVIAIAASVLPLRAMRRTSLVEQIRSVD